MTLKNKKTHYEFSHKIKVITPNPHEKEFIISYTHFTINERIRIKIFSLFSFSTHSITKLLNHHHSTITH